MIAYSGRHSTMYCVVRDISDTGARLQIPNAMQVPDTFELIIELDGFEAACEVAWRNETELGLKFVAEPQQVAPKRAQVISESIVEKKTSILRTGQSGSGNEQGAKAAQSPGKTANVTAIRPANVEPASAIKHAVQNSIPILIAEDDPDDRLLIQEAFDESDFDHPISFVKDGEELLNYLAASAEAPDCPKPGLILLDLNMPRMDGRQALQRLKKNPDTRRIPVVVFTTSNADDDIENTYDLGVSSYITKPSSFEGLMEVIRTLNVYWSNAVVLPAANRA